MNPLGLFLEPPGPLLTHLHAVYMAYSECLPTRLNPLAERTCFSQVEEARVDWIECAYVSLNGAPACASPMLGDVLRESWNFSGVVVSDEGAIEYIATRHRYTATLAGAAAVSINAGVDMDMQHGAGAFRPGRNR